MNKYLNIEIAGQDNVGVIDLGKVNISDPETKRTDDIKHTLEPKLVKALEEHFDCPVKIRLTNVTSVLAPIQVKATVVVESDGCDYTEEVTMNETWVY